MTGKRKTPANQDQTDLLATVFECSPNILILVDADGRVEKINRTGSEIADSPQEELIGLLGGEVFQCIHSFDGKGCGRNPVCQDCPIRTRVNRSFNESMTILNEEGRLTVRRDAREIPMDFLISTVPVNIDGDRKVLITIVDITERKRVEERMRYQAYLLENVSDAIISTDSNFSIQSWNRAAEEIYGWEESEVLGRTVDEILKSGFQEPLKEILGHFSEERSWRGEATQYRKDGTPISVLSSVRLIQDDEGKLVRTIATNRDITERKQTVEAFRKSELQNRTILHTALDGFWLIDPEEGRILEVNNAYCQMSGYTREEILQMRISDFEAIEASEEVLEHTPKNYFEGKDRFESAHKHKDGSVFEVEVSVQSMRVNGGKNFAFIRDISARKEAEEALRESEEQYRLLFDEMLSGFALHEIICDEDGKPVDYRFLVVNSAFEELTGLKADNLIGKTVLEVLPVVEPFWIERYGRVALQGEIAQFEGYSAGVGKHYEARAFCPELGKFAVMFHDISERKQAERRLKKLLQEKEILLAEMHHRVKNNLQIITSLLGLQAREITDEHFLAAFEESRNRINSMALVHEQLYRAGEYARIEIADYIDQLASTLFNMYQVDRELIQLQIDAEGVYLDLEKAIPCGLLLNELISNSLKYAFPNAEKGEILIKLTGKDEKMILEVGDDGVGIPANFNLETSQSLGLQLVNLLTAHDLNGSIELERNKGTQFRIEFPVQTRNEE